MLPKKEGRALQLWELINFESILSRKWKKNSSSRASPVYKHQRQQSGPAGTQSLSMAGSVKRGPKRAFSQGRTEMTAQTYSLSMSKAPDPVWSLKLSRVGPGENFSERNDRSVPRRAIHMVKKSTHGEPTVGQPQYSKHQRRQPPDTALRPLPFEVVFLGWNDCSMS